MPVQTTLCLWVCISRNGIAAVGRLERANMSLLLVALPAGNHNPCAGHQAHSLSSAPEYGADVTMAVLQAADGDLWTITLPGDHTVLLASFKQLDMTASVVVLCQSYVWAGICRIDFHPDLGLSRL